MELQPIAIVMILVAGTSGTILRYDAFPRVLRSTSPLFSELHHPEAMSSVLTHPYLQNHNLSRMTNRLEPLYHNTTLTRVTRSLSRKTRAFDTQTLLETAIGLEVKWYAPLAHFGEHGEFVAGFISEDEYDIFTMTEETARSWKGQFTPVVTNMERMISMMGVDGRSCVLRAICDLSATPSLQPGGLTGEMMHVFLRYLISSESPMSNEIDGVLDNGLDDYVMAGLYGREGIKCHSHYKSCPISLLNLVTEPSC